MSKSPIDLLLNDICQAIDRIEQYIENLSFDAFSAEVECRTCGGGSIVRVHDVAEVVDVVEVTNAIENA